MEFTDYVAKVATRGQFQNNAASVFFGKLPNLRIYKVVAHNM